MSSYDKSENERSLVKIIMAVLIIVVVSEWIGVTSIHIGKTTINFLPMLYAVILGVIITPDLLGNYIKPLGRFISRKEISITGNVVMLALLPLGVKYGTLVGPNIRAVINAGLLLSSRKLATLVQC
ncbi:hypothetical protein SK36_01281 [Citrobacter sp. MGH106]|nr:hypothetical protein SK36_01281 [Citrobacter sp. MGH106]